MSEHPVWPNPETRRHLLAEVREQRVMLANQAASIIAYQRQIREQDYKLSEQQGLLVEYQRKKRELQGLLDMAMAKATTFSMQLDDADKLLGVATRRGFFK